MFLAAYQPSSKFRALSADLHLLFMYKEAKQFS